MCCVEKLIGTAKTVTEAVKSNELVKNLVIIAVLLSVLWYLLGTIPDGGDVSRGFADTKQELRNVGNSIDAISDGIGNSERLASTIGTRANESAARAERLGGNLQRAKTGAGKAEGGVSEAEKRIIIAESIIRQSISRLGESRKILAGYRAGIQKGPQEAGKKN